MAKARKTTSHTPQDAGSSSLSSSSSASTVAPPEETREEAGDRDRIAMRAYELYLARGGADGGDFDDWLAAERELASSNGKTSREDAGE